LIERNLQSAIQNPHIALPFAEGNGSLEDVNQLTCKQVSNDIVDGSEETVGAGSSHQDIVLACIVQYVFGGLQ
jgi:hypothetical protein